MRIPISFNTADKNTTLTNRLALKAFIEKGFKKEGIAIDTLQYVFCGEYRCRKNHTFLSLKVRLLFLQLLIRNILL